MSLYGNHVIVTMSNLATMYRSNDHGPAPGLLAENVHRLTKEDLDRISRAADKYEARHLSVAQEGAGGASRPAPALPGGAPHVIRRYVVVL